jgi:hypothetical protein
MQAKATPDHQQPESAAESADRQLAETESTAHQQLAGIFYNPLNPRSGSNRYSRQHESQRLLIQIYWF